MTLDRDGLAQVGVGFVLELGLIAVHFNGLTSRLRWITGALLTSEEEVGEIATVELSFRQLAMLATSLMAYRASQDASLEETRKAFDLLIKRCLKAEEQRNQLLHSSWYALPAEEAGPAALFRHKPTAKFKGYQSIVEEFETDEIRKVARELQAAERALLSFAFSKKGLHRFFERHMHRVTLSELRDAKEATNRQRASSPAGEQE
jgi:hypothetical protein